MSLNIVAERKMSLKGFAEGWDDCYLKVRTANESKRKAWLAGFGADADEETAEKVIREACLEVIVGGVIMSTDENGIATPVEFTVADVAEVVDAINFFWQQEVVSVATGVNRLKAKN
ncbi:hypothetical protein [Pseudarthrobacter sp. H2]|uniref:hypothetical protein n=1 Tax=Pseudarthrobacter sp. H2 TaxID=3418415 RepID=UPI003CE7A3AB